MFGRVLLNPDQFSDAMKRGSTEHCICSGEGSALSTEQGNSGRDPGSGNSVKQSPHLVSSIIRRWTWSHSFIDFNGFQFA